MALFLKPDNFNFVQLGYAQTREFILWYFTRKLFFLNNSIGCNLFPWKKKFILNLPPFFYVNKNFYFVFVLKNSNLRINSNLLCKIIFIRILFAANQNENQQTENDLLNTWNIVYEKKNSEWPMPTTIKYFNFVCQIIQTNKTSSIP